jgi:hypothetical protein
MKTLWGLIIEEEENEYTNIEMKIEEQRKRGRKKIGG